MSEAAEVKVDTRFEQWFKTVDLGDDSQRILARWQGIKSLFPNVDGDNILPICQLAFGGVRPAAQQLTQFEEAFKEHDDSFVIGSNDAELRILAAGCVLNELEEARHAREDVYMAIAGASFAGLRKFSVNFDIKNLVESTLTRLACDAAVRPELGNIDSSPFSFKPDIPQLWDSNREAALKSMANSINVRLSSVRVNVQALNKVVDAQDDELQILWWLFGGKSLDRKVPFSKVSTDIRPLIFAKELADTVKTAPGPASISEILAKAGVSSSGKLNVLSAIACLPEWGLTISHQEITPNAWLHPLHFALHLQAQAGNGWQQFWAGSAKVAVDVELTPLALALQFYRERLQLRSA